MNRWARRIHDDGRGRCTVYLSPDGLYEVSDELVQPTAHEGPWKPWTLRKHEGGGVFVYVTDGDGNPLQFGTAAAARRYAMEES